MLLCHMVFICFDMQIGTDFLFCRYLQWYFFCNAMDLIINGTLGYFLLRRQDFGRFFITGL